MTTFGINLARVTLLGLALSSSAIGATYSWEAPAGGSFFSGSLWSPTGVPGAADRAIFDLSSAYSVNFNQSFPVPPFTVTNERLRVGDDDVTFAMFARTYNLTSMSTTSLSIGGIQRGLGSADDGRLRITGGALNVQSAIIGDGALGGLFGFGSGTLEIGAAFFSSSGALVIGQGTTGNFTIDSGGAADTTLATIGGDYNRSGTATVTGVGSTWTSDTLDVGGNSNGTLNILSGGLVHTIDVTDVYVGAASGKTGTVNVSGIASKWDHEGSFIIGHGGNGVLNISAGGVIEAAGFNRSTVLGNLSGSDGTATVSGTNSRWAETNSNHVLVVGNQGTGSASVAHGAIASFDVVRIGQHPSGSGTVDVQGTGSQWNSAFGIYVGGTEFADGGSGTLNIGLGGKVTVSALYATKIWHQGIVNLNGGTLETGRLEVMGGNFNWTSGMLYLTGGPLSIEPSGLFGDAVAIETGKHLRSIELIVGNAGDGAVSVDFGASVQSDVGFTVGRTGAGTVEVNGGLLMTNFVNQIGDQPGSEGTVTISNAGRWEVVGTAVSDFNIGNQGTGTLSVFSGSVVNLNFQTVPSLGRTSTGRGSVLVSGIGAELFIELHDLQVGEFGQGDVQVSNGGRVILPNSNLILGNQPGSAGDLAVDGTGSLVTAAGVYVGQLGSGTLHITNGGRLDANNEVVIAAGVWSHGIAVLEGTASRLTAISGLGYLNVGSGSNGSLMISSGAQAEAKSVIIGDGFGNIGEVQVSASTLSATNEIEVGYLGHGLLTLSNDGLASAPFISVNELSSISGNGTLQGNVLSEGTVSPGLSVGLLAIDGDYQQLASGRLAIELGGPIPQSDYDVIAIDGTALLGGTLRVDLINGFRPAGGAIFSVLTTTMGISGQFDGLVLPLLNGGRSWDVHYNTDAVQLVAGFYAADFDLDGNLDCMDINGLVADIAAGNNSPRYDLTADGQVNGADLTEWLLMAGGANLASGNSYLVGDANLDGVVDGQDFISWNANKFTSVAAWCSGDFNADGVIDGQDFIEWNSNKFMSANSVVAVPEPRTCAVLLVTMMFAIERGRRLPNSLNTLTGHKSTSVNWKNKTFTFTPIRRQSTGLQNPRTERNPTRAGRPVVAARQTALQAPGVPKSWRNWLEKRLSRFDS